MTPVFSISYLPSINYIKNIINYDNILIENYEFFIKQTYRTRCYIYSPNGKQMLNIPIVHLKNNDGKQLIKDIKIDYSENWQKQHLKSLETAYRSTPYYEFYEDKLTKFYKEKWENLFDFNLELLKTILNIIKHEVKINFTEKYIKEYIKNDFFDLRNYFNPKEEPIKNNKEYFQIFSSKYGFLEDLSIIDLIFIKGNNTLTFLKENL